MRKSTENFVLFNSPGYYISNYDIQLFKSGLGEVEFVNELMLILDNAFSSVNIDTEYDRHNYEAIFSEMVSIVDSLSKEIYGYKFSTSVDFFFDDPELAIEECGQFAETINSTEDIGEYELNAAARVTKLCALYNFAIKINFTQSKIKRLQIDEVPETKTPIAFKIALLHETGFFDLPAIKALSQKKQYSIAQMLIGGDERTIKGNILVLSPHSNESTLKYTAHTYTEKAKNMLK